MKIASSVLLAMLAVLALASCSKETSAPESEPTSTKVNYEVLINSLGALKITFKDNKGALIVEDPVEANTVGVTWKKQYMFDGAVDTLLRVEMAEGAPPDPVAAEFFIAIDDERVQKGTKFITRKKGMTLTFSRPQSP